jgi:hypothetical protein
LGKKPIAGKSMAGTILFSPRLIATGNLSNVTGRKRKVRLAEEEAA